MLEKTHASIGRSCKFHAETIIIIIMIISSDGKQTDLVVRYLVISVIVELCS